MKNLILKGIILSIFIFFHVGYGQHQLSKVIYKIKKNKPLIKTKKDTKDKSSLKVYNLLKNAYDKMEDMEYVLLFNKEESSFKEEKSMDVDGDNVSYLKVARSFAGADGIFYTNLKEKKRIHQTEFSSDTYLVSSPINIKRWKLSRITKKIGKYTCYKATTTKIIQTVSKGDIEEPVIAWYTPVIPHAFGPADYVGLPGLIMEVTFHGATIYAKKIVLNTKSSEKINPPKRGIKIVKDNYSKEVTKAAKSLKERKRRKRRSQ